MDNRTASLTAEAEALKETYAALNRNDIPAAVSVFAPQIEWTDPYADATSGTYSGLEAVTAHFSRARGTWAEGSCEPEQFIVAGDKVIVFVNVRVRLKDHTEWSVGQLADVYTFRNGKAIQGRSFPDRQHALEWAGISRADAG